MSTTLITTHRCWTCDFDGDEDDSECIDCRGFDKWKESNLSKAIRAGERDRLIKLIEAKQDAVGEKLAVLKNMYNSQPYEEGQLEGKRDMCEALIDELQGMK